MTLRKLPGSAATPVSRRSVLKGAGAVAGAALLSAPFVRPSHARTALRVSNFGGFFEKSFVKGVYPLFTKKTGIAIESIAQATSSQFLIQMAQAKKAGSAPMDVCIATQADLIRGRRQGLWTPFDRSKIPNLSNIPGQYNFDDSSGLQGVGAMAWYITFIANPGEMKPLPESWTDLWKTGEARFGLQSGGASVLFEIAAECYFGGTAILDTEEGIDKVVAKIAELKPNVKLWWTDEGSMQNAYQNDEVLGGMYYHDVAQTMKASGTPVESVFPKEGGLLGFNAWCLPASATRTEEAHEFVNWTATPECHEAIARTVFATPLIERSKLNLTEEEFAAVGSSRRPIVVNAAAKVAHADYMTKRFLAMVTG